MRMSRRNFLAWGGGVMAAGALGTGGAGALEALGSARAGASGR